MTPQYLYCRSQLNPEPEPQLSSYPFQVTAHERRDLCLLLHHVGARGVRQRGVLPAAERRWVDRLARALAEPGDPVRPPAALVALRSREPCLRRLGRPLVD